MNAAVVVLFYPNIPCFTATHVVGCGRGRRAKNLSRGVTRSKGEKWKVTPMSWDNGRRDGGEK